MSFWTTILALVLSAAMGGLAQWSLRSSSDDRRLEAPDLRPPNALQPPIPITHRKADRPTLEAVLASEAWPLFRLLGRFLPGASLDELKQLANAWGYKVQEPAYPSIVWKLLLARWVELDPESAMKCQKRVGYTIWGFCEQTWLDLDYENALSFLLKNGEPDYRMLIPAVAIKEPQLALQWVKDEPEASKYIYILMEVWAARDAEAAISATEELTGQLKNTAIRTIIDHLAERSPLQAMRLVDQLDSAKSREEATRNVLKAMTRIDPGAAAKEIAALPQTRLRTKIFAEYVKSKCQTDPQAAWEWAKGLTNTHERHQAINLAAERLARDDPKKLFSLYEEVGWQYASPAPQAGERVRHSGGGSSSRGISSGVRDAIEQLAQEDPRAALQALSKLPRASSQGDGLETATLSMLRAIGTAWAQESPEEMIARMSAIPDNYAIDFISRYVTADADASQRGRMVDYLAEHADTPEAHQWAEDLVSRQAKEDPEAALSWANRLDTTGVFDAKGAELSASGAYNRIAQAWTTQDSQAASEWISEMQPGARRDGAVMGMVSSLMQGDAPNWEAAFAWAQSLDGERDRNNWLRNTFNGWHRKDPEAAEEALISSALPESALETLRAGVAP